MTLSDIYARIKQVLFGQRPSLSSPQTVENINQQSQQEMEDMAGVLQAIEQPTTQDSSSDSFFDLPFEDTQPEEVKKVKPTIDPLKPFERNFAGVALVEIPPNETSRYTERIKQLEKEFAEQGRPFTQEQYQNIFKELLSLKNFLHEDKSPVLKKLWEDSLFIYEALSPLHQLGLSFTLDITGGAARDFVLNRHDKIKDIDFMISVGNTTDQLFQIKKQQLIEIFGEEEVKAVDLESSQKRDAYIKSLIELCMRKAKDCQEVFFFNDRSNVEKDDNDSYKSVTFSQNRLLAVIKTSGEKTHFPCDLLITDYVKPVFLNDFDYDICKASFSIVNDHYHTTFPKHFTHLISRFTAELDFYADVVNKTMTYQASSRSMSQIDSSINKHLPRLMDKYEDYTTLITHQNAIHYDYAKASTLKYCIERKLEKQAALMPVEEKKSKRLKI